MGKFEKYTNKKLKFKIDEVDLEIDFRVRDRIELAAIHEIKTQADQYGRLIEFCTKLLVRSYPEEKDVAVFENFLTTNMEKFLEEIMVGANLATREMFRRPGEFRKEEGNKGGVPAEANAKP